MVVTAIGWRAHAALAASGERAVIIAPLSRSVYAEAGGELLWIGPPGTPLHARAVVTSGLTVPAATTLHVPVAGVVPWRPAPFASTRAPEAARVARTVLNALGEPRGLARLLAPGRSEDDVTRRARPSALALAEACTTDDAATVADAARPLLGLGPGLTPSGDDFVGGALFARRVLGSNAAWDAAVACIVADAATLTHPISARLLADLAAGEGWAPLHDLATALAEDDAETAVAAARHLTSLGHTSGWDILAGFTAGLGNAPRG